MNALYLFLTLPPEIRGLYTKPLEAKCTSTTETQLNRAAIAGRGHRACGMEQQEITAREWLSDYQGLHRPRQGSRQQPGRDGRNATEDTNICELPFPAPADADPPRLLCLCNCLCMCFTDC